MIFKKLGNSELAISAIGLGTGGSFGQVGSKRDSELIHLVKEAIDLGVNFFDTAEIYSGGHSEKILGGAIHGKRDKVIIASKFSPEHSSRKKIIQALDGSLKRLRSDYIDLYQVHWPNLSIPLEETISTLEAQLKKGKIRLIGISNFSLLRIKEAIKTLRFSHLSSIQNEYNFSERSAERDILPFCVNKKITFIAYNPLSSGFPLKNKNQSRFLARLAKKYGRTEAQIVLNWLISKKNVVAIPGTTSSKHLRENTKSASLSMEKIDLDLFDKIFEQKVVLVPIGDIDVLDDGRTYLSVEEALKNDQTLVPSPLELSKEIKAGDFLKPVKLRKNNRKNKKYQLFGGKIRFWAWVIAFEGKKSVPAVID